MWDKDSKKKIGDRESEAREPDDELRIPAGMV